MKKLVGSLFAVAIILPFYSQTAAAFSTSPLYYSRAGIQEILGDMSIVSKLPSEAPIRSIQQTSTNPYQFTVKAGDCEIVVELNTKTPKGFIGNGLPSNPRIVETSGCDE